MDTNSLPTGRMSVALGELREYLTANETKYPGTGRVLRVLLKRPESVTLIFDRYPEPWNPGMNPGFGGESIE